METTLQSDFRKPDSNVKNSFCSPSSPPLRIFNCSLSCWYCSDRLDIPRFVFAPAPWYWCSATTALHFYI